MLHREIFHIQFASLCRDRGISSFNGRNAPTDDIDRDVRPHGAWYDMGADETRIIF